MKKIVVICGATATGKTALAVEMAKEFNGEVVSADSMQIYKGMNIATAKPSLGERQGIAHHMMDIISPKEKFSVADYVKQAARVIDDIISRGKLPIITGGTGLYISSLVDNIQFDEMKSDGVFRREMEKLAREKGNQFLHDKLERVDPETAKKLHPNNLNRVIRGLEVFHQTGEKISEVQRKSRLSPSPYEPCMIGLDYPNRQYLYERINRRVDEMMEMGLLQEAREFFSLPFATTSAQAIGYKELFPYIKGEASLEECLDKLKQETRKYAKRQFTWFKKDERIHWLKNEGNDDFEKNVNKSKKIIALFLKV